MAGFRIQLSEKLMELGNIAFTAFVVNQIFGQGEKSLLLYVAGSIIVLSLYFLSYLIYGWN